MGNIMAALAYLFGWLSGLIVFFISKDDKVARFHGMQAILFNIAYFVVMMGAMVLAIVLMAVLGIVGGMLNLGGITAILFLLPYGLVMLLGLGVFLLMLWTMWQAFNDKMYKLPLVGGMAESWAK